MRRPNEELGNRAGMSRAYRRPGAAPTIRLPIALKFALFILLLTVLAMAWVTLKAVAVAEKLQEQEVNRKGLLALNLVIAYTEPQWIEDPSKRDALQRSVKAAFHECRELGVIDILIGSGSEVLETGRGAETIEVSLHSREIHSDEATRQDVTIREFTYQSDPIRSFQRSVTSAAGGSNPVGSVQVLLSARQIDQSRQRVRNAMFGISAVTAILAAIGSFLLASFLTRPIRTLVRDLRQVSLGRLDHKSDIGSPDELGDLARTFNQMTDNLRLAQEVLIAQKAAEHELNLATQIQQRLLPSTVPDLSGFDVAAHYQSAKEVGGDYYDFLRIDQQHFGVALADVSGKGIPASLVMTMTRSLLRLASRGSTSPSEVVRSVNRTLAPDMSPGMFVTLLYFVLHVPSRKVRLIRAGHNEPLHYSAKSASVAPLSPRGIAIGLDPHGALFDSELEVLELSLEPGDILVAFTDGVTEAKNAQGLDYSEERLRKTVVSSSHYSAEEILQQILADVDNHRDGAERSDDITLLIIKLTG